MEKVQNMTAIRIRAARWVQGAFEGALMTGVPSALIMFASNGVVQTLSAVTACVSAAAVLGSRAVRSLVGRPLTSRPVSREAAVAVVLTSALGIGAGYALHASHEPPQKAGSSLQSVPAGATDFNFNAAGATAREQPDFDEYFEDFTRQTPTPR